MLRQFRLLKQVQKRNGRPPIKFIPAPARPNTIEQGGTNSTWHFTRVCFVLNFAIANVVDATIARCVDARDRGGLRFPSVFEIKLSSKTPRFHRRATRIFDPAATLCSTIEQAATEFLQLACPTRSIQVVWIEQATDRVIPSLRTVRVRFMRTQPSHHGRQPQNHIHHNAPNMRTWDRTALRIHLRDRFGIQAIVFASTITRSHNTKTTIRKRGRNGINRNRERKSLTRRGRVCERDHTARARRPCGSSNRWRPKPNDWARFEVRRSKNANLTDNCW